jgi:hypothetical protein
LLELGRKMGIEKMGHLWENWYAQETINLFFTKPLNYFLGKCTKALFLCSNPIFTVELQLSCYKYKVHHPHYIALKQLEREKKRGPYWR